MITDMQEARLEVWKTFMQANPPKEFLPLTNLEIIAKWVILGE